MPLIGKAKKNVKIGIFGHYGNKNLGDEAIIAAVIQNLRKRRPECEIYGFSMRPVDTVKRNNIPSFPIRKVSRVISRKIEDGILGPESFNNKKASSIFEAWKNFSKKFKSRLKEIKPIYFFLKAFKLILVNLFELFREISFLRKSYRVLNGIDVLIISGSNQFLDNFGGPCGFPYTLLKWSILAKLAGVKVVFISMGAGPINSRLSLGMIRICLKMSNFVSYRDKGSKKLIEGGKNNADRVFPDLAFSLMTNEKNQQTRSFFEDERKPVIGINPMPVYDYRYWPIADETKYKTYIGKIANLSLQLMREGYKFFFFNTQHADLRVIEDILTIAEIDCDSSIKAIYDVKSSSSIQELVDTMRLTDIIIATRFHGLVLSYLIEKPSIGLCYGRKMNELMRVTGQGRFSLWIDIFSVEEIMGNINLLCANYANEVDQISQKKREYQVALEKQYSLIL